MALTAATSVSACPCSCLCAGLGRGSCLTTCALLSACCPAERQGLQDKVADTRFLNMHPHDCQAPRHVGTSARTAQLLLAQSLHPGPQLRHTTSTATAAQGTSHTLLRAHAPAGGPTATPQTLGALRATCVPPSPHTRSCSAHGGKRSVSSSTAMCGTLCRSPAQAATAHTPWRDPRPAHQCDLAHVSKVVVDELSRHAHEKAAHAQRDPPHPPHREGLVDCRRRESGGKLVRRVAQRECCCAFRRAVRF
jgi:hypothetical protein